MFTMRANVSRPVVDLYDIIDGVAGLKELDIFTIWLLWQISLSLCICVRKGSSKQDCIKALKILLRSQRQLGFLLYIAKFNFSADGCI